MVDFKTAFARTALLETGGDSNGGYTNDPEDPGGETKWGISKRSYPNEDIKNMTRERAAVIFKRDFWDAVGGDSLPDGVAYQAADAAYNCGPDNAIRFLQRAVRVLDDGHWGKLSRAALATFTESDIIKRFLAARIRHHVRSSKWDRFGRGWMNRIAINLEYGAEDSD